MLEVSCCFIYFAALKTPHRTIPIMKKILIVYFSQSGQQMRILQSLAAPLQEAGHEVYFENLKPVKPFPFPWNAYEFFNAFPETFTQQPIELEPLSRQASDTYDLVIIGYQPWFLTPSRPISSFLQSEGGRQI